MSDKYYLLILVSILVASTFYIIRFKQATGKNGETSKTPILSGSLLGLILGSVLSVLLSMYVLPPAWLQNSDIPRTLNLCVLGGFLGLVLGGVFSVFFNRDGQD